MFRQLGPRSRISEHQWLWVPAFAGTTSLAVAMPSGVPAGGFGAFAEIAGPEIVGAEVGQLALQALDVQPQRPALAEHQHRAAAGRLAGMKLDPDQFQHG